MTKLTTTISTLWQRAPMWRFSLLSCTFLGFLFFLFPPASVQQVKPATPVLQTASYKSVLLPTTDEARPTTATAQIQELGANALTAPTQKPAEQHTEQAQTPANSDASNSANAESKPVEAKTGSLSLAAPSSILPDTTRGVTTFRDSFSVVGFQLPLPPGDWVMLASNSGTIPNSYGSNYTLGKVENGRLVAAVIALAFKSNLRPGSGYDLFNGCTNSMSIFVVNEGATANDHQSCWLMNNYFTPPWRQWRDRNNKMDNLMRAAAGEMEAKGINYPQDFIAVLFFRAEKWGMVKVSYLFSPENEGIKSSTESTFRDSDWFVLNLHKFPEKVTYASKIKDWATDFWPRVKIAFAAGE